jgi:peptide/nickel transport system permease protein
VSTIAAPAPAPAQRTEKQVARHETLGQLARSHTFVPGILIVAFWVFCAIFGSHIAPHDPLAQTSDQLVGPSRAHLFGTDQLGRDVFSRVLAGSYSIMIIAPAATAVAIVGGTILGLITGYFSGPPDDILSRIIEAILAIPLIVIAVTVIAALGHSTLTIISVIGVVFMPLVARTVRAAVLGERGLDYVVASRLRGERSPYVLFAEILPNVTPPIIVETTVRLGYAIFTVAGLTFLGFGVQPPSPDWAVQISDNYALLNAGTYWWTVAFPALAIASLIIAINLIADGVAQVLER